MEDLHTLITIREIDAPVARVWAAWRDPAKIAKWWGPSGFHSEVRELDLRTGGRLDLLMYDPDGTDYPNVYIFDHVDPEKRIIFTNIGSERYGLAAFQSVLTLERIGDRTRAVLTARLRRKKTYANMSRISRRSRDRGNCWSGWRRSRGSCCAVRPWAGVPLAAR